MYQWLVFHFECDLVIVHASLHDLRCKMHVVLDSATGL